jgi:predicted acylesterase/phospholipase RssA
MARCRTYSYEAQGALSYYVSTLLNIARIHHCSKMDNHWNLPARVLSLDGGGVRGLSELMILQRIMNDIADAERAPVGSLRSCDYFDLICGTSTGGLIAILLGRLKLTVKEAIDTNIELSQDIFAKDHSSAVFGSSIRASKGGRSRFDARVLQSKIQDTVARFCNDKDERLYDPDLERVARGQRPCHVAVLAVFEYRVNNPQPQLFKSWDRNDNVKIWEAARATSAAPTFFDPIEIGTSPVCYIDAGLGFNNPAEEAFSEIHERWPNRSIGVFVSLGTGKEEGISVKRSGSSLFGIRAQAKLVSSLVQMTTSATRVHDQMWRRFSNYRPGNNDRIYFRFNVDEGLNKIGLQEWKRTAELATQTTAYLTQAQVKEDKRIFADQIRLLSRRSRPFELASSAFTPIHEND